MENYENDEALEKQKEIFYQIVWSCLRDYPQTRLRPLPVMIAQGKHVDLFEVSTRVRDLGGFDAVTQKKLWPSIASESLGLEPSCGAALKLVFLKYLKQPQKWLQRGCTSRARGSLAGEPALDFKPQRRKPAKRRRDSLAGMLESVRFVAKNAGSELKGAWLEECVPRALKARELLFAAASGSDSCVPLKKKHKIHHVRYEERMKSKSEDLAGQLATQTSVPVFDFPLQPFSPSSSFASFLPGVHPIRGTVASIQIQTGEDITQNSESLRSICHKASCKVDLKVHFPRKRVRIGSEFQAKVPVWKGPLKKSPKQIGDEDSTFNHHMDDSRWLLKPTWPMENCEMVVNKEKIGKGRSDGCFCALQGSIECVKLHIKDEREILKKELGVAFLDWRFDDMGDTVSEKWSEEEKQKFSALVRLNPASLEKNFWNYLPTCLPAKKIEDLVSYYFNVFVLTRRGTQNRAEPYNIDSDDDESEVATAENGNVKTLKHIGSINKVGMLNFDNSEKKTGRQACCMSNSNFSLKRLSTCGEGTIMLPHLEDDNSIHVQKQHGMVPLNYNMEYLQTLQENDFQGVVTVEKL